MIKMIQTIGHGCSRYIGILLLLTTTNQANAYVDPGTGAYLVQLIAAALGAALFYLRHPIQLLRTLWEKIFGSRRDRGE